MRSIQKGSCVLVVLTIMSMLLMFGLATYKSAIFFEQFSLLRVTHEQKLILTRSLLECGIATVARNYKKVSEYQNPWILQLIASDCQGEIQICKTTQGIMLSAALIKPIKSDNILTCLITQKSDGKIQVWGFQSS